MRATLAGEVVVDSTQALLVWEPQRVLPAYAVPREHIRGELLPAPTPPRPPDRCGFQLPDGQTVLDPPCRSPSTPPTASRSASAPPARPATASPSPADPDLDGLVLLDFAGFDAWYEEDDLVLGHPRDSSTGSRSCPARARYAIELDGVVLAESAPARNCSSSTRSFPSAPICRPRTSSCRCGPAPTRTRCPYKGEASYWSVELDGRTSTISPGATRSRCPAAAPVAGLSASSTNAST